MMVLKKYYQRTTQVPQTVKSFLIKGFLLFVLWKAIYLLFLLPSRTLDKPLTGFTAINAARVLNTLTNTKDFTVKPETDEYNDNGFVELQPMESIYYHQHRVLSIADVCNALELLVLYAGFIICYPSGLKRKIAFITGGIIFICCINVLRCAGLTWIFMHYPNYGDFSHHFVFTFIVYAFIFLLWLWFSKKTGKNAEA
ncbi:hypothetical protein [Parafilimonas sp.]|uniref:hypothetical protein n=1 Tax=Parafilimonas sp. TaxID=1969739 RepID=UPI0039E223F2